MIYAPVLPHDNSVFNYLESPSLTPLLTMSPGE